MHKPTLISMRFALGNGRNVTLEFTLHFFVHSLGNAATNGHWPGPRIASLGPRSGYTNEERN